MIKKGPSIFDFFNYRDYLGAYFAHRKEMNRHFSHRTFAQKAGYTSSGLYLLLVSGRQNLTPALISKFSKAMELNERETVYLKKMVDFTHAKTSEAKQEIFEQLIAILPRRVKSIVKEQRDYYLDWYNIAVREALDILDISDDYSSLAHFLDPAIKASEAKTSIKLLASLGMIQLDKKGYWRATDASLVSTPELGAVIVHPFQKTMMDMGKAGLEKFPPTVRNISCSTFSISELGLEGIRLKIDDFLKDIAEWVRLDENSNQVYQCNVQFFPLSKKKT